MTRSPIAAQRTARRELARAQGDLDRLEDAARPARGRVGAGWFGAAVGLVLVIAVAAGIAVAWRATREHYSDTDYRRFATTAVGLLLTPDARDRDRAQRILDVSTGTFRDEFAQSTGAYSDFVARLGTVATGTVDGVAIAQRDGDAVTALVTSVVTTRVTATPQAGDSGDRDTSSPRRFRLRVQIEPDGGSLKLADVEFLP